jgi:DNA processing protein
LYFVVLGCAAPMLSAWPAGAALSEGVRLSEEQRLDWLRGEQGREVFAVPGSPLDPRSEGTNGLLKQGATLVTEAADVIAALEPIMGRGLDLPAQEPAWDTPAPLEGEPGDDERSRIIALLGPTPSAIDDLVRLSRTSPAIVRRAAGTRNRRKAGAPRRSIGIADITCDTNSA